MSIQNMDELGYRIQRTVAKRHAQNLPTCADDVSDLAKLAALMEEVGEVARAIHDEESRKRLQDELYDVAVAATLWAGSLDRLVGQVA